MPSGPASTRELARRTSRGAFVTLAGNLLLRALSLVSLVLVARLLDADAFGAASLALAVFALCDAATSPVLTTVLLGERDAPGRRIDAAWTVALGRGMALAIAFALAAPPLAGLWQAPAEVEGYLRWLALAFALQGAFNLHAVRFRRELRFGRAFALDSVQPAATAISTVLGLCLTRDARWLVLGPPIGALFAAVTSFALVRPLPRPVLDRGEFAALWRSGRFLALNTLIVCTLFNLDDLLVAELGGLGALGIYVLAWRVVNVPLTGVLAGYNSVLLPAYLRVVDDPERLRHAAASALSILVATAALLAGGLAAWSRELFAVLSGLHRDWSPCAPVVVSLVPFVLARGINSALTPLFVARGVPGRLTALSACQLALLVPAVVLGHRALGLAGVALAVSVLGLCASVVMLVQAERLLGTGRGALWAGALAPVLVAALATSAGVVLSEPIAVPGARLAIGGLTLCGGFVWLWETFGAFAERRGMPYYSVLRIAGHVVGRTAAR
jgi:O-antigen/teichoic acid export membrane protein